MHDWGRGLKLPGGGAYLRGVSYLGDLLTARSSGVCRFSDCKVGGRARLAKDDQSMENLHTSLPGEVVGGELTFKLRSSACLCDGESCYKK